MTSVEVVSPGALTTFQDLGRPGWAHIGVPRSGAADRGSLQRTNRLVGNPPGAVALETTLVGPRLRADAAVVIALSGARVAARIGDVQVPMDTAVTLPGGATLSIGTARTGLRTYVAFGGGLDAELTLGSAATDLLTGLGPAPLARGDILRLGERPGTRAALELPNGIDLDSEARLRVLNGPRDDWFTEDALGVLVTASFTVTPASNRVGLRLDGPALRRSIARELPSEGLVPGAIQVTPDGRPILMLADHPTTGGYPVIAVVTDADIPRAAQLRPGQQVEFVLGAGPTSARRA